MTEVCNCGGGHHTRLRQCLFMCSRVPPSLIYKAVRGKAGRPLGRAKEGEVLLLVGVGLPFPSPTRKEEGGRKERERERERGAAPPSPCPIRTGLGRGARHLLAAASPSH